MSKILTGPFLHTEMIHVLFWVEFWKEIGYLEEVKSELCS